MMARPPHQPFFNLLWQDAENPGRSVFVTHKPEHRVNKWGVFTTDRHGNELCLSYRPGLREAVHFALAASHQQGSLRNGVDLTVEHDTTNHDRRTE